jgi:hypothetical protein
MFNKKFDGKYTGVRRPIICNGLKEIKAYRLEVVEHNAVDEEQPEPQPEPEGAPVLPRTQSA